MTSTTPSSFALDRTPEIVASPRALSDLGRTALATLMLSCLWVTMQPFQTKFVEGATSGSPVNQLGYGLLALVGGLVLLTATPRPALRALASPVWIVMALVLVQSAAHSPTPDASLRAVLFALAAMTSATAVLCLTPSVAAFRLVLAGAALAVLGLCYGGIVALPGAAIHDASGPEAAHAGLWRGVYPHKNMAGPVMATLFFAGLYLLRCRWRLVGGAIAVLAAIFAIQTGSKTTAALLPAVAVLVTFGRMFGGRILPVAALAVLLAAMALLTLGAAISPVLYDGLQWILPGTTFTGRLDLWRFAIGVLGDRGWTGLGFESFWATPVVKGAEISMELSWDPRGIVNAHNGFLDVAIALGWPGLACAVAVIVVLPFRDFLRIGRGREEVRLGDFFLMVLAFSLLNAMLESFLFSRNNPVWISTWLAIVGLRLLATRDVADRR
ncbi:O-antigen ligase family protein [Aureimonas pseudogalii]|uniref:O-antigen ligase n=1 Tax=Aureimonas pseudogalii TaxID=1744844 RepID=A0A7W6H698_9HYPH|nr:O-antigen ligase [Aureimonas pseudogalii]MBB3999362.1 O-antigen ligase [Aureimonas pseudogalii]